jgi:hypothetical protein
VLVTAFLVTTAVANRAMAYPAAPTQQPPTTPPKSPSKAPARAHRRAGQDSLTSADREEIRRVAREANQAKRAADRADTSARRALARAAEPTAFADSGAKTLLARARAAREQQDSALRSYSATATQRMSVGMGVRKIGLEKLLWRGDNVAKIEWKRGTGVWVTPIGSRMVVPMVDKTQSDGFTSAISVPYFPGKETLWLPDGGGGVAKTDINERDIIHPIARGAEAYYRYATGDSMSFRLPDGRTIAIRELRITARRPDWHLFVGSFWFDVNSGQLVRAAYRLSVDIDLWALASAAAVDDKTNSATIDRLRDSIGRATLSRAVYVKDSAMLAGRARNGGNDDVPGWVKFSLRPAKAKLDGITVEYGLFEGKFWLPVANSATASAQVGFMRTPLTIDEKFTYESVDGDLSLPPLPVSVAQRFRDDSLARAAGKIPRDSSALIADNSSVQMCVGTDCGDLSPAKRDSVNRAQLELARKRRDVALAAAGSARDSARANATFNSRRDVQCTRDSTWVRTETRYDGALRMAYRMPCNLAQLETAKELPPVYASDGQLFDARTRDDLLATLDLGLQPAWMPERPSIRSGVDLLRFNRIEGLSVGVAVTEVLGAGYVARALARFGTADLHANAELGVERSNGKRTAFATVFHRLDAVNPEWGGALTFGPSLPAFLYTRDEGFYYRTFGAEIGERYERRHGAFTYRLFVERQYTAGDSDVVNTFSLGRAFGNRHFAPNIQSERSAFTGIDGTWQQGYGSNPVGFRLATTVRGEAATGSRQYARGSVEGTLTRPIGLLMASVTGSTGYSAGTVPAQRLWYMGGLRSVRGQVAGTQEGDAFWLTRSEVGVRNGFLRPVAFFDIGWAGVREKYGQTGTQRGAGVGLSFLDGLFRIDVSRGLFPLKRWRTDLYLEAPI